MRIQHNISALNTHRNLAFNNAQASKNLEKLSSGYKINRAGDDAAGLAISEKMRGQIRGLDMATKNSQDAISLIQTAEGALNETHAILQRMRELSVQSGNDTNVNTDRDAIQQEIEQLTKEIDRIAETTEFNTQSLLDGSFAGKFQIGANENQDMGMDIGSMSAATLGLTKSVVAETGVDAKGLKDGAYKIEGTKLLDAKGNEVGKIDTDASKILLADGVKQIEFANIKNLTDGATINVKGGQADLRMSSAVLETGAGATDVADGTYTIKDGNVLNSAGEVKGKVDGSTVKVDTGSGEKTITFGSKASVANGASFTVDTNTATSFSNGFPNVAAGKYEISGTNVLKDGVKVGEFDDAKKTVTIKTNGGKDSVSFKAVELGLKGEFETNVKEFTIGGVDVSTREQATGTITAVDSAIKKVSEQRSQLGAVQNRLEHTINNLGAASENLTAAESRIRDTDMAKEMMEFTKNNILMQAAQSMLAQANQQPQGVLQLLG